MSENIVKIWFVGNNDTEHPDIEISDSEVKRYDGGVDITKTTSTNKVNMLIPNHNLNIIIQRVSIDEDST